MKLFARMLFLPIVFALLIAPPVLRSQEDTGADQQSLEPYIAFAEKQMKRDRIPALAIGFCRYDAVRGQTWVHSFGYSDLENQVKASSEAAYRLASVSKMMTAAAVLQLVEKGGMNLDAEIQTYVPYFPKKPWPVTVRQILGHLGGISHYHDYSTEGRIKEHKSTREAIAIFENFDLAAEPGTRYVYSTYGYNLLGAAVEGASGRTFAEYMKQGIFDPAGMNSTRLDDPADLIPWRIRGYRLENGEIKNSEFVDISSRLGGGSLRSTIPDLLRFVLAINRAAILSPESRSLMFTSMATRNGRWTQYGMGWGIGSLHGRLFYSHSGSQQETRTLVYNFPSRGLIIAAASNMEDVSPTLYARRLYQVLEKEPWSAEIYTGNPMQDSVIRTMQNTYESGMAWFDLHGKPMAEELARLSKSFEYVNDCVLEKNLRLEREAVEKRIAEGIHPVAGEPFTVAGSYMSARLAKAGTDPLHKYARAGAIPFFFDYMQLYRRDGSIPKRYLFSTGFEQRLKTWNAVWTGQQTDALENLWVTADTDFQNLAALLRGAFGKSALYPDLTAQFSDTVFDLVTSGETDRALQAARLDAELYPRSDSAMVASALAYAAAQDPVSARSALKNAVEINKSGKASADSLNDLAYSLAQYGKTSTAVSLLALAVEIHPADAGLYESLGEAHLLLKDRAKAIDAFRKALELDAGNESLKKKLEDLEKPR